MQSLAVKYRPHSFEECIGQQSIIKILKKQLETGSISNCYLFTGPSGTGKTTLARIVADAINNGIGEPIEIDAASNSGVDSVRSIIETASERSVTGKYKVFIFDECHAFSTAAWQAFLKCIEEPPQYTIFMFCTTEPTKVPATIANRVMRFNLHKLPVVAIKERLTHICQQEGKQNFEETVDYISNLSNGCAREAIAQLEKVFNYSDELSIQNTCEALGTYSYDILLGLVNAILDGEEKFVLSTLDVLHNNGRDMKFFVDELLRLYLDLNKYALFRSIDVTAIPGSYENILSGLINFESPEKYYSYIVNNLLDLKNMIKNDSDVFTTVEVFLLKLTRCQ